MPPQVGIGDGNRLTGLPWLWLLALLPLAAAGWWWRRRRQEARPVRVPVIQKPQLPVAANDDSAASGLTGRDGSGPAPQLAVELVAMKLTRSFMNATLAYRITVRNRGAAPARELAVTGELVGAHGSQPLENQIASAEARLPLLHTVDRLAPGQALSLDGTLVLPVHAITPIRQGSAALFVPLLRLVVSGPGLDPLARTFVVGQPGTGLTGRLQPFRLDEPPRSYQPIAQRALD
ncbi:hypothetical protein EYB45_11090 [Erythrobacteraceae bacterium CFH 75059]|nr:hypothetical protein EYB45_11090 [Erythrobacteraceae bacterium CFH 75059]